MKFFESFSFRTKLLLLLLIPLTGMLGFGTFSIFEKQSLMNQMDRMTQLSHLAVRISNLIHETQKERGLTAGFLGNKHENKAFLEAFRQALSGQRIATEEKAEELKQFVSTMDIKKNYSNSLHLYQKAIGLYDQIGTLRNQVDGLTISGQDTIEQYTEINNSFLNTINHLSSLAATVEIAYLTGTYVNFLQGKERAGIERAIITNTFSRNRFGTDHYRTFSALVSEQDTFFQVFQTMALPHQKKFFEDKMAQPSIQEVQRMRDIAFKSGYASTLYVKLGELYKNMALRGAYHSVKNLLIRGSWYGFEGKQTWPEKQRHYKKQFDGNYQAIQSIIEEILHLPAPDLSKDQRQDVNTIWANIQAYHKSIDVIIELQNQGKKLHEIDYDKARGVKIDDMPADQAIRRLVQSTAVGTFGIDPSYWFDTITLKINHLKEIENLLSNDLIKRTLTLRSEAQITFLGYLFFILLILSLSLLLGILILRQIKHQTDQILKINEQMIAGDLTIRIPTSNHNHSDELGRIIKSMNTLVENLEKSTEINQQTMNALKQSETRIRSVLEAAPDAILSLNTKGEIEAINHTGENLFGYYPGTLIQEPITLLVPTLDISNKKEGGSWIAKGITSEQSFNHTLEVDGVCKDSGSFPLEISVSSYMLEDAERQFTLIIKDITERKQAKMALSRAYNDLENRVRERTKELEQTNTKLFAEIDERIRAEQGLKLASKVFENANEGILITDPTVNIIRVNRAFGTISGYNHDELLGKNPGFMKSGRHDEGFYKHMWETIHKTGEWSGEIWNRRKSGETFPQRLSITSVWNKENELTNFVGIFSDITQIKETEWRLEKMAYFDALTDLPNRVLFRDRLQHELAQAERHDSKLAVLFIDLDRFKHVNDSLGHTAGDKLLVEVSQRIKACLRKTDTVARLGGDEFAAILTDLKQGRDAAPSANDIVNTLKQVFTLEGHDVFIGASIGISIYPTDGKDIETLTKRADIAMYKAKEGGRGRIKFYEESVNTGAQDHLTLESNLRKGLENNEFLLHYQPKVCLETGKMTGMESLVRWLPKGGKMIPPGVFIPLAEETGVILPLGSWILQQACQQTALWREAGHTMQIAVNLSVLQLQQKNLVSLVKETLEQAGLAPEALELEITESMVMGNVEKAIETMHQLKKLGISIAVDDFGTGYSSLNYLKKFPIDTLKIDQSFVRELVTDQGNAAIVSSILSLGKALNLKVVAEGVETREQLEILQSKACEEMQGYYFSKPLPSEQFQLLLNKGTSLTDIV